MEQNSNVMSKLKNKKKDIILADNITETTIKKTEEIKANDVNANKNLVQNSIKLENPLLENSEKEIETNKTKNEENVDHCKEISKSENEGNIESIKKDEENKYDAEQTSSNNNIVNHVIFNIQLFFSRDKKIYTIIYELFINYLSVEHLKAILEERDCIEVCGNILCDNKIEKAKMKKFYYNSKLKEFVKEDVLSFFCDVRCFQKFKDGIKIANNFDFLRLFKFESLYLFYNIKNYFSEELYLKKISGIIKPLYETYLKNIDGIKLEMLKVKYDNYFLEEKNKKQEDKNSESEKSSNKKENSFELNKVFEDKVILDN